MEVSQSKARQNRGVGRNAGETAGRVYKRCVSDRPAVESQTIFGETKKAQSDGQGGISLKREVLPQGSNEWKESGQGDDLSRLGGNTAATKEERAQER